MKQVKIHVAGRNMAKSRNQMKASVTKAKYDMGGWNRQKLFYEGHARFCLKCESLTKKQWEAIDMFEAGT